MDEPEKKKLKLWKLAVGAVVLLILIAALIWALLLGPWYFEGDRVRDSTLAPAAGLIITGFRTMLITLVAAVVAALGLYYTYRNHTLAQQQFKEAQKQFAKQHEQAQEQFKLAQQQFMHAQEQFTHTRETDRKQADLTHEGQVTERYVEAVKLLSSDDLTQRLGGIYSLERIMRDSKKDRATIVEVLAGFVRCSSSKVWDKRSRVASRGRERPESGGNSLHGNVQDQDGEGPRQWDRARFLLGDVFSSDPRLPEDVQAALTVLGRKEDGAAGLIVGLHKACLSGADLKGANLNGADMRGTDLSEADLSHANLSGTNMRRAFLSCAFLSEADLNGADLTKANLEGACLSEAKLVDAELVDANLKGAKLVDATLSGALLSGADLAQADLWGAQLTGAKLCGADLEQADLADADLKDADLSGANLTKVSGLTVEQLLQAKLSKTTQLPPGWVQNHEIQANITHHGAGNEQAQTGGV
ncbi:pentapeptide repeat-containing protein [Streptomyces sp. NPDC018352]|uniref:pentapeptide repeat-containing protein n=1 Tax=Streptomyces sp. NPDC018352 TaxID=3157194 RepID=UPI0033DA3D1F